MTRLEKGIQSDNSVTRAPVLHLEFSVHTYIPWIYKCVKNTAGCRTSYKYTYTQIYGIKYYKHFTKTIL